MAIQWADNFTSYGTSTASRTAMLDGLPYATISSISSFNGTVQVDPDPNSQTGFAFRLPASDSDPFDQFRIALPTVVTGKLNMALRCWLEALPTTEGRRPSPIGFQNGSGTNIVYALVNQNGSISIVGRVSNVNTVVADTVNPVVSPSSYNHMELEHDNSTGEGKFYLNSVEILSWTGVDTDEGAIELVHSITAIGNTTATAVFIKDLVIQDDTGTANTGQIGSVSVFTLRPDADVTLGDWSPSTGSTAFNLLNKTSVNDTTYVSAADIPMPSDALEMTVSNLPPDITTVRGLISVVRSRKTDGGDGNLQTGLTGTLTDLGADRPVTTAFKYSFDVSELSPDTGAAWTPVEVDAVKLQVNRTL